MATFAEPRPYKTRVRVKTSALIVKSHSLGKLKSVPLDKYLGINRLERILRNPSLMVDASRRSYLYPMCL